jgi:hypothetical protein
VSNSFDSVFHWAACFIYLKASFVLPYLFDKSFYTTNFKLIKYRKTQQRLKWLNIVNYLVIFLGFIVIVPIIIFNDKLKLSSTIYFVSLIPNQTQFMFSCFGMIYAVCKLNQEIKAMRSLVPRNGLLYTHVVLLILNTVTQLLYYLHQYWYFKLGCFTDLNITRCPKVGDMMMLWNGAWRLTDALSYALILYMMYKFLVPTEKVDVIKEASWLKSQQSTDAETRSGG